MYLSNDIHIHSFTPLNSKPAFSTALRTSSRDDVTGNIYVHLFSPAGEAEGVKEHPKTTKAETGNGFGFVLMMVMDVMLG